jgi:hypothetical protein
MDRSIKGHSPILRQGYKKGGTVKVRDINKDGKKEGWEVARAKGMAKGMGRRVKKGLYYYMNRAKKRGTSRPGKGTVSDKALKQSAKTAKKK